MSALSGCATAGLQFDPPGQNPGFPTFFTGADSKQTDSRSKLTICARGAALRRTHVTPNHIIPFWPGGDPGPKIQDN